MIQGDLNRAIGVFDSGVGGLSVLQHIRQVLPAENFIYVADSQYAPYGNKSSDFIRERSLAISRFLCQQSVKAIVVACNTATAASVDVLRQTFDCPVVAMEPALKPAVLRSRNGRVGILATESTLASQQYQRLVERYGGGVECIAQPATGLVECVENGLLEAEHTRQLLHSYLQPMLEKHIDSLVLGCTHYPFLMPMIQSIVGPGVDVIDTGRAVAEQLKRVLAVNDLLSPDGSDALTLSDGTFYSSSDPAHTRRLIAQLLGMEVEVKLLEC